MTSENKPYKSNTIKKDFPALLTKCMGIVSKACQTAGIDRSTYYEWRKIDPEWAALCDACNEYVLDQVESVLFDKILIEKDSTCTIFFLKHRAHKIKDREYIERKEHSGPNGQPIQQEVIYSETQSRNAEMIKKITGNSNAE